MGLTIEEAIELIQSVAIQTVVPDSDEAPAFHAHKMCIFCEETDDNAWDTVVHRDDCGYAKTLENS